MWRPLPVAARCLSGCSRSRFSRRITSRGPARIWRILLVLRLVEQNKDYQREHQQQNRFKHDHSFSMLKIEKESDRSSNQSNRQSANKSEVGDSSPDDACRHALRLFPAGNERNHNDPQTQQQTEQSCDEDL